MRKLFTIVLFLGIQFFHEKTSAQDSLAQGQTLKEVVISASRTEMEMLQAPRTITVINRDKIEGSTYNSLGDLLSREEGIYIVGANQTPGTNQSLFLRGANSNQVTVMIDGVRITDPSSPNNAIDLSEISLTNVERVEIIEGAHSTLYGGSAIGGVVNIITRKGEPGFHGFAGLQAGTFGEKTAGFSEYAEVTGTLGNGLYINASVFNQDVNGLNAALDTVENGRIPDQDDFTKTDYSLKAGYRKNKIDAFVSFKNTHQRADIDVGAYQDDDNDYVLFDRDLWTYGASYQFNDQWKASVIGSVSDLERTNENDSSLLSTSAYDGNYSNNHYRGGLTTNELQLTYKTKAITGIVGLGVFEEEMSFDNYFYSSQFGGFESTTNYDSIDTRANTKYLFGQLQWKGGSEGKYGVTAGGRLSQHSIFGNFATFEVSPSLSLSSSSLLFANISSGFNAPSLYQLFDPTTNFGGTITRGNRDLKPEASISFEAGFKKQFSTGSHVTASLFHTVTKNAIEYVYVWNKDTPIDELTFLDYMGDSYLNINQMEVNGVEVAGTWVIGHGFSLNGNLSAFSPRVKTSSEDVDTNHTEGNHVQMYSNGAFLDGTNETSYLVRRPKVTSFEEIRYQAGSWRFSVANRIAGSRYDSYYDPALGPFGALAQSEVKTYSLFDAGVSWNASKWMAIILKMENIFDTDYQEIQGYSTRGRSGYIKLNFKW